MDEDLEKQNKKLQEDPDDFAVKNHIFTQESMVSCLLFFFAWHSYLGVFFLSSVNLYPMKDTLKKLLENVLYKYSKPNVELLMLLL